ncbi:MAG: esterase [Pseudomonadota bacterium]
MNDAADNSSIVVQRPGGTPAELVLLFHGVGASADDLVPLARHVARARPQAMVASIGAPFPFDMGEGRQWFSLLGVTEADRPARVAAAMPAFAGAVAHWQAGSGVAAGRTTLIGFSQGAIMALEATQADLPKPLACRVIAIAGRFAQPVRRAPASVALHLIHGADDPVIAVQQSVRAAEALRQLGADTTLDVLPALGHGVDQRVVELVVSYLGGAA